MDVKNWNIEDGVFSLSEPAGGCSLKNYLSNGEYGLCIDHLGAGYSVTLDPSSREGRCYVSHHGYGFAPKGRFLYCLDRSTGAVWNASFAPTKTSLDRYRCKHAPGWTSFEGAKDGIECESRHFLPREGRFEIWWIIAKNTGKKLRSVSLCAQMEFLLQSGYSVDYPYYSWYTDSRYDASRGTLEIFSRKPSDRPMLGFCKSLSKPDGFDAGLFAFLGTGDERRPGSLFADRASCVSGAGEPPVGAFRYDIALMPGETWSTVILAGEGADSLADCERRFSSVDAVASEWWSANMRTKKELEPQGTFAKSASRPPRASSGMTRAGSCSLDASDREWFETFLPWQIRQQSLGMIRFNYRGYRDVAQDAMGMSHYDLASSRRLILDLAGMQHENGRCLRQLNTLGPVHDERDFRDLPFWLPLAVSRYCRAGGSSDILRELVPYLEGGEGAAILDHIARGLKYALRFGKHDLLEIGVGDWNDALSSFGPEGESLWLNEIAYLALGCLDELLDAGTGRESLALDIPALRDRLYAGVVEGWTGSWFLRGYSEAGAAIGGEDRIFLLPQAWFTISGMSARDPDRARIALDSMVNRLDHPDGLLKCHPAFTEYDPEIGNLSALTPGIAENFAVYNHASAFGIDALFLAGRREEAMRYLGRLLPLRKDFARTRAEPYVLVNYYNGGFYPEREGRGGISWMTGTANWLAMILFDFLLPDPGAEEKRCNFSSGTLP